MPKPVAGDFNPYHTPYLNIVPESEVMAAFEAHTGPFISFLQSIPAAKLDHAYASGKWTVKQMLQHITDTERVFVYRAMRIVRNDQTELPGFDENLFAENARVDHLNWNDMIEEFVHVRKASGYFFRALNEAELQRSCIVNGSRVTANSLGFITVGHTLHHQRILRERYL